MSWAFVGIFTNPTNEMIHSYFQIFLYFINFRNLTFFTKTNFDVKEPRFMIWHVRHALQKCVSFEHPDRCTWNVFGQGYTNSISRHRFIFTKNSQNLGPVNLEFFFKLFGECTLVWLNKSNSKGLRLGIIRWLCIGLGVEVSKWTA